MGKAEHVLSARTDDNHPAKACWFSLRTGARTIFSAGGKVSQL